MSGRYNPPSGVRNWRSLPRRELLLLPVCNFARAWDWHSRLLGQSRRSRAADKTAPKLLAASQRWPTFSAWPVIAVDITANSVRVIRPSILLYGGDAL